MHHQFGHFRGVIFRALGVSALALGMFDFAMASLLAQVGCERMVVSHNGPRLLDWGTIDDGSQTEAAAMEIGLLNICKVVETVALAAQFWQFPPCGTSRPLKGPGATYLGDGIGEYNERHDEPSAACFVFLHLGAKTRS